MSVDVNYYSFSPSRADRQWCNAMEDLSVLRKKHSTWDQHEKDSQEYQIKKDKVINSFEPRISEIRKKIFDFFDKKGFIIPWVEWNENQGTDIHGNLMTITDEIKMEYLQVYGCVYPRGSDLKKKDVPYLMLRMDAPELEKSYNQIINERDQAISELRGQIIIAPMEDKSVVLNNRQEELDDNTDLSYLKYKNAFNENELAFDLKSLDMYYGSVVNEYFECPKLEADCLEALIKTYNLITENNIPTRNEWIRLFQNLNDEKIQEACNNYAGNSDRDKEEAEWIIKDYLRSVRSVVKDLKTTPDAIFIRMYGEDREVEPNNSEEILMKRAKKHAAKYSGQLLPVL